MVIFIYFSLRKAALWWLIVEESNARMDLRGLVEPSSKAVQ